MAIVAAFILILVLTAAMFVISNTDCPSHLVIPVKSMVSLIHPCNMALTTLDSNNKLKIIHIPLIKTPAIPEKPSPAFPNYTQPSARNLTYSPAKSAVNLAYPRQKKITPPRRLEIQRNANDKFLAPNVPTPAPSRPACIVIISYKLAGPAIKPHVTMEGPPPGRTEISR